VDGVMMHDGPRLREYARSRGLCERCVAVKTHKRQGYLPWRQKWHPLTIKNAEGGYVVYKGYCLQPTCYTLEQAKRNSGERPTARVSKRIDPTLEIADDWPTSPRMAAKLSPATVKQRTGSPKNSIPSMKPLVDDSDDDSYQELGLQTRDDCIQDDYESVSEDYSLVPDEVDGSRMLPMSMLTQDDSTDTEAANITDSTPPSVSMCMMEPFAQVWEYADGVSVASSDVLSFYKEGNDEDLPVVSNDEIISPGPREGPRIVTPSDEDCKRIHQQDSADSLTERKSPCTIVDELELSYDSSVHGASRELVDQLLALPLPFKVVCVQTLATLYHEGYQFVAKDIAMKWDIALDAIRQVLEHCTERHLDDGVQAALLLFQAVLQSAQPESVVDCVLYVLKTSPYSRKASLITALDLLLTVLPKIKATVSDKNLLALLSASCALLNSSAFDADLDYFIICSVAELLDLISFRGLYISLGTDDVHHLIQGILGLLSISSPPIMTIAVSTVVTLIGWGSGWQSSLMSLGATEVVANIFARKMSSDFEVCRTIALTSTVAMFRIIVNHMIDEELLESCVLQTLCERVAQYQSDKQMVPLIWGMAHEILMKQEKRPKLQHGLLEFISTIITHLHPTNTPNEQQLRRFLRFLQVSVSVESVAYKVLPIDWNGTAKGLLVACNHYSQKTSELSCAVLTKSVEFENTCVKGPLLTTQVRELLHDFALQLIGGGHSQQAKGWNLLGKLFRGFDTPKQVATFNSIVTEGISTPASQAVACDMATYIVLGADRKSRAAYGESIIYLTSQLSCTQPLVALQASHALCVVMSKSFEAGSIVSSIENIESTFVQAMLTHSASSKMQADVLSMVASHALSHEISFQRGLLEEGFLEALVLALKLHGGFVLEPLRRAALLSLPLATIQELEKIQNSLVGQLTQLISSHSCDDRTQNDMLEITVCLCTGPKSQYFSKVFTDCLPIIVGNLEKRANDAEFASAVVQFVRCVAPHCDEAVLDACSLVETCSAAAFSNISHPFLLRQTLKLLTSLATNPDTNEYLSNSFSKVSESMVMTMEFLADRPADLTIILLAFSNITSVVNCIYKQDDMKAVIRVVIDAMQSFPTLKTLQDAAIRVLKACTRQKKHHKVLLSFSSELLPLLLRAVDAFPASLKERGHYVIRRL